MGQVKNELFTNEICFDQECEMYINQYSSKTENIKNPIIREGELSNVAYVLSEDEYNKKLEKAEEDADNISSRRTDRYLQLLKECKCLTEAKQLVEFPKDAVKKLEDLKIKFPHGVEILDNIIALVHLQHFSLNPFARIPSILIHGSSGTGKSKLTKEISKIISPEVYYLNLSVAPEAFFLSGLTLNYDSGDIGQIAKILKSKYGNVFVVIEEIDKAIGISNNQLRTSPMVPLLDLLEPDSAKQFSDEALEGIKLDTSHLSYLATANSIDMIPSPLLSRMMTYKLGQPTQEQIKLQICNSIWNDILQEETWGHAFSSILDIDRSLLSKSPV